jgi:hypothetical protein
MDTRKSRELKVPYQLILTNLSGAFTSPPSENFDPSSASSASRKAHGLLWRRPTEKDDPAVRAAWDRAFSHPWDAAKRIKPQLEPQIGKTHNLRDLKRVSDSNFTDPNWSGAVLSGKWTLVIGFWRVPTVTKSAEPQGTEGGWNSAS